MNIEDTFDKNKLRCKQGEHLKKWRSQNEYISLRSMSKKLNIDPSNLSKMERGLLTMSWETYKKYYTLNKDR